LEPIGNAAASKKKKLNKLPELYYTRELRARLGVKMSQPKGQI